MSYEVNTFTDPALLSRAVEAYRQPDSEVKPAVAKLGGGVLRFAYAAFPGASNDEIYAFKIEREPEGRGAHFDVYETVNDKSFPCVGVYNIDGENDLTLAELPKNLADAYFETYPSSSDDAKEARRHFAAIALGSPTVSVYNGVLGPDMGLVLPQRREGPHIIHDIVPKNSLSPGSFVKLFVPSGDKKVLSEILEFGYEPLDDFMTAQLSAAPKAKTIPILPRTETPTRSFIERAAELARRPAKEQPKRPCHYD